MASVSCPHCDGEGYNWREADTLDVIEGLDNGHGLVVSTCLTCGGSGSISSELAAQYVDDEEPDG